MFLLTLAVCVYGVLMVFQFRALSDAIGDIRDALDNADGNVRLLVHEDGELDSGRGLVDTVIWFDDGEAFAKRLPYEAAPSVNDTIDLDLSSDDGMPEGNVSFYISAVHHDGSGGLSVEASVGVGSDPYRDALLRGGWVPIDGSDDEEDGDVLVRTDAGGERKGTER